MLKLFVYFQGVSREEDMMTKKAAVQLAVLPVVQTKQQPMLFHRDELMEALEFLMYLMMQWRVREDVKQVHIHHHHHKKTLKNV